MRLSGVNIPDEKKLNVSLSYLYGVGRRNVWDILKKANVSGEKRTKELTEEEQRRIQGILDQIKTEGDLRAEVLQNIKRLKEIGSYRGSRHGKNLPVRGQRTRSNARTKRGKRVTIGAIKKEVALRMEGASTQSEAKTEAPKE
ncbi:MAG: 30S ribosomal protein S13 [Patescibacteria group bacterium]